MFEMGTTDAGALLLCGLLSLWAAPASAEWLIGGTVGYFFERYKWLGLDMDVSTATPNINARQASVTGGTGLGANGGQNLRITTWSTNLVARYPGERFRPYAGGGLGVFFANAPGVTSSNWRPGANGFAGLNILLIEHVSMSLEYRYHYANLRFDNVLGPAFQSDLHLEHVEPGAQLPLLTANSRTPHSRRAEPIHWRTL
jgi:opacity protein-like surface antigen